MNNSTITQKCLIVGLIAAICASTGIIDVFSAFIRTSINGTANGSCGFGYGYDSASGYGNGYGATCPISNWWNIWGGAYRYVPLPNEIIVNTGSTKTTTDVNSNTGSITNTGVTTKPTTQTENTKPITKPTNNPYGSNYNNLDDGLTNFNKSNNWEVNSNIKESTNNTTSESNAKNGITGKRMLPATGAN